MKCIGSLTAAMCVTAILLPTDAVSARKSSTSAGHALARQICSECHAVERKTAPSPNLDAPGFRRIADTKGMTAKFLSIEIRRVHEVMPNINLNANELRDVVAYILSLRRGN